VGSLPRDHHQHTERIVRRTPQPRARRVETGRGPAWLGEEPASVQDLKAMLVPYPSDEMISWPVNTRVGNVKNNDPNLIEPITLH
jgi:putative SOS response-associated peptidase YedK